MSRKSPRPQLWTWTCDLCHVINAYYRKRCRKCGLMRRIPTRGGNKWRYGRS